MKQPEVPQTQQIQLETRSSTREEHEDVHEESPAEEDDDTSNFQEIEEMSQQSL